MTTTARLTIHGMSCSGCVNSVRRALSSIAGVGKVSVSLEESQALVDYDPQKVSLEQLKGVIEEAGYDVPG
ncbi:MAG: heavy-metal-associated domain-containing protein [Pseudomonadota bacterium]|nr:heavy-metal-associated domain-containing protein [Pseudomonadota bacterium]